MITFPLFLLLGLLAGLLLKTKAVKAGALFLGVLLGLSLASTAFGPPILTGITDVSTAVIGGLASMGGA